MKRSDKSNQNNKKYEDDYISKQQITLLHVAKNKLGIGDELYHDILESVAGVSSTTKITKGQFDLLLEHFRGLGFKIKRKPSKGQKKYEEFAGRPDMATPSQLRYIEAMYTEWINLKYPDKDNQPYIGPGLRHFLRYHYHVDSMRFVTRKVGIMAIEGLKNALNRERLKARSKSLSGKEESKHDPDKPEKEGSSGGGSIKKVW